ncbi:MAG TPA: hypothetical protein DD429_10155 [Clostridiaceae bacterium]|nr:hypothetical protein [Clostridiaceae bacterium]
MPTRRSAKFSLAWYIVVISSLFAAVILYCDFDKPDYYFLLPLLPLTFATINIAAVKVYENIYKNIGLILVIGLYYCRIVIVPVIMSIGNYSSLQKYNVFQNMPSAIFLMIYELIIAYMVLYLTAGRSGCIEDENAAADISSSISTGAFKTIIVCILLFDISVFIFIPESRRLYIDIFKAMRQTDYEIFYIDDVISRGSLKRACVTLYSMTMEFVRIFVPAYFMISIRKKSGEKLIGIILSIPFILAQFLLVSNTQANSILCALVLMLLIAKLYPSWSAKIYRVSLMFGILFIVCYFAFKHRMPSNLYGGMTMGERASQLANAYFSGPDNIAAVFNVTTQDKWTPLFYTLISSIPFNGTLFGIEGSNFSSLYNYYNGSLFQIAPCIGESYFYFGAVLSPIVPGIFVNLAIRYGRKVQMKISLWKYVTYIYFILLLAISPVMYNGTIFLKTFMETILPMMILSSLSKG